MCNTGTPKMFQYSPILGRSSIWDLKYTFSLVWVPSPLKSILINESISETMSLYIILDIPYREVTEIFPETTAPGEGPLILALRRIAALYSLHGDCGITAYCCVAMKLNSFKGVLHPWALFLKTLCIFSKNKATSDRASYGYGQKCSKELKNHSLTSVETIVVKLQ